MGTQTKSDSGMTRVKSAGFLGPSDTKPERRVLVLFTGGTIGMIRNENGVLAPVPNMLKTKIRSYPQLHDEEYAFKRFGTDKNDYLVLPSSQESCRVLYTIHEYGTLLDSSNMSMNEWIQIAIDIKRAYQIYDGYVILHGTDTLTYTASALSFMLENLGKTVVVTGSQIPIFESRSDGKDNFAAAILFAGTYVIPEVTVFFGNNLFRGNRTIKVSSASFHAFDSPNFAPLATVGININVDYKNIFRPTSIEKFSVHTKLNQNVGLLRIFPSITTATMKLFLQPPIQGVILQSYGAGNIPSNRKDLLQVLEEATDRGIIIVNCTQCAQGSVQEIYETGQILKKAGVISGLDMTPEAALSKLSYVLAKEEWDIETKRKMMSKNLRGELTSTSFQELNEFDLVGAVASTLNLTSPEDIYHLQTVLCPSMLMAAVSERSIVKLKMLKSLGVDMSSQNIDKRTALHAACVDGDIEIVSFLLRHGCSVHVRDSSAEILEEATLAYSELIPSKCNSRLDRTPLYDAIENNHHQVIRLLVECGAHLTGSSRLIGEQLCLAAARGSVVRLQSFQIAGADLTQTDSSGRTALHVAALHGHEEVVEYLLSQNCDPYVSDMTGMIPSRLAEYRNHNHIVELIRNFNFEQLSI